MNNPIFNPYSSEDTIPFEENIFLTNCINAKQRISNRKRLHFRTLKRQTSCKLLRLRTKISPYHIHKSLRIRARTL